MKVRDPAAAIIQIENYLYATSQMAQTTLRSVLGEHQLDDLLAEREKINDTLKLIIDKRTDEWGIEVSAVEVKDVDLPENMKRAMARQAEAERERRAKIINAEGELQASEKLAAAAHIIGAEPAAITLRYLQTVSEIASEKNSTTLFPLPIDLLGPFLQRAAGALGGDQRTDHPAALPATGPRQALGAPAPVPPPPPQVAQPAEQHRLTTPPIRTGQE
jgi:regulator of protease activity HflC (stomatin/prohibitin superfamily)